MHYIFYLDCDEDFSTLRKFIIRNNQLINGELLRDTDNEFKMTCEWFDVTIKTGGQSLIFTSEDYKMNLQFTFWFDIFHNVEGWAEGLMIFIGIILREYKGDCVLESNGDTPIIVRRDGVLEVDDKSLKGTTRFPFEFLNQKYKEANIEKV